MGSMFSAPSVPSYSPVQYIAPSYANNAVSQSSNDDEMQSSEEAVKNVIRKTSRGRNSLIQTSYRGVLGESNSLIPQRKSLLGE